MQPLQPAVGGLHDIGGELRDLTQGLGRVAPGERAQFPRQGGDVEAMFQEEGIAGQQAGESARMALDGGDDVAGAAGRIMLGGPRPSGRAQGAVNRREQRGQLGQRGRGRALHGVGAHGVVAVL